MKHWKIEFETLENTFGNGIVKWKLKHWKKVLKLLENAIEKFKRKQEKLATCNTNIGK